MFWLIDKNFYLSVDDRTMSNPQNHSSTFNSKPIWVISECKQCRHQHHTWSICAKFPIRNASMIFGTKVSYEPTHKKRLKNPQENFFQKEIYTQKEKSRCEGSSNCFGQTRIVLWLLFRGFFSFFQLLVPFMFKLVAKGLRFICCYDSVQIFFCKIFFGSLPDESIVPPIQTMKTFQKNQVGITFFRLPKKCSG